ncbi:MAG: hypothetical protein H7A25_23025 [Leptospiraceae bacterium]|nr:hypothetical protein [Leptospiraceae bacterium]
MKLFLILLSAIFFTLPVLSSDLVHCIPKGFETYYKNLKLPSTASSNYQKARELDVKGLETQFTPLLFNPKDKPKDCVSDTFFSDFGKGAYRWEPSVGIQLIQKLEEKVLKIQGHRIHFYKLKPNETSVFWIFPDDTALKFQFRENIAFEEITYFKKSGNRQDYKRLIQAGAYLQEKIGVGNYELHFNPSFAKYAYLFSNSDLSAELGRFLEELLGIQNSKGVPILLFENREAYVNFTGKNSAAEDLYTDRGLIAICCSDYMLADYDFSYQNQKILEEVIYRKLIHAMTFQALKAGCYENGRGIDEYSTYEPPPFFSAAISEYFLAEQNTSYRALIYQKFYNSLYKHSIPELNKKESPFSLNFAIFSKMFMAYFLNREEEKGLQELYKLSCKGKPVSEAINSITGFPLEEYYRKSLRHYQKNPALYTPFFKKHKQIETLYFPEEETTLPGFERLSQNYIFPDNIFEVENIPFFLYAYQLDLPSHLKQSKEEFDRKNNANLYSLYAGNYSIENGKYSIIHHYSRETNKLYKVSLEYGSHKITNYVDGRQEWIFPDKTRLSTKISDPKKKRYFINEFSEVKAKYKKTYTEKDFTGGKEEFSLSAYTLLPGEKLQLKFSGLKKTYNNLYSLNPREEPISILSKQNGFLPQNESEILEISTDSLKPGDYELRFFINWPHSGMKAAKKLAFQIVEKKEEVKINGGK